MARIRRDGPEGAPRTVRLSVPLSAVEYARLGVLSDLEGRPRAEIAAELVRRGLVGVVARDDRKIEATGATGAVEPKL